MKYKIRHPESSYEWIAENPKKEDIELWLKEGCSILEIKEVEEIRKALLIGITKLISVPCQAFHLWYCPECNQLFNSSMKNIFKIIDCPNCHKKIELGNITK